MRVGLFSKVMSLSLPKRPPVGKPKIKGKAKKKKRIKRASQKKLLDVFKVVLETDTGQDPSHQQESFFDVHFSKLSKAQLKQFREKLTKIRERCLEGTHEERQISQVDMFIRSAVERRLERSRKTMIQLQNDIKRKLRKFENIEGIVSEGKISAVATPSGELPIRRFVKQEFEEEIQRYNQYLENGDIIPERQGITGVGFVLREVRRFFEEKG